MQTRSQDFASFARIVTMMSRDITTRANTRMLGISDEIGDRTNLCPHGL